MRFFEKLAVAYFLLGHPVYEHRVNSFTCKTISIFSTAILAEQKGAKAAAESGCACGGSERCGSISVRSNGLYYSCPVHSRPFEPIFFIVLITQVTGPQC